MSTRRGGRSSVHDFADPIVSELEARLATVQHPVAHELLDAVGGVGFSKICRPPEQREVERPPDHRRDGHEPAAPVAQPLDPK